MKITFNIEYRTNWGYSVFIVGNVKELGLGNVDDAVRMQYTSNDLWTFSLELKTDIRNLEYYYVVMSEDGNVFDLEWGDPHRLLPCRDNVTHVNIFDSWKPIPSNKPFYSSAFTQGVFARTCKPSFTEAVGNDVVMKIMAPMVTPEQVLAISGEIPSLGEWNVNKALIMDSTNFPEWVVAFSTAGVSKPFEYKFLLLDRHTHEVIAWENCNNRNYGILSGSNEVVELSGLQFNNPLPLWKGAGTAIPVFSLRSEEDMGVGDFYDLMKMVDWAEQSGQRIIQLLPINDTTMTHTWMDSYPYNANSTFALHPMYIRPSAVGELSNVSKINDFNARAKQLNELPQVDYEQVNALKTEYMRCLYDEIGEKQKKFVPFRSFVKNNLYWLKPYAAFCVLRDKFNTPDFTKWSEFSVYNEAAVDIFAAEHANEIEFVYFVQFHLDKQLREVRNYAHKHGVVLKGDIPIGISRTSVDAWTSPQLFNMNSQAGAPPDDFSVLGQNWGFPTYNWEEMEKDGFTWWKNRFRKMAEYFDAYRIDHILGFFRIWQIPMSAVHGLLGVFYPAMPFSEEGLRNGYDFNFNREVHTKPFIEEDLINNLFGEYAEEVKKQYLKQNFSGRFDLEDFVENQHLISLYFSNKEENEKNQLIKNGLMALVDEVLFIVDEENPEKVHPRISATNTRAFRNLDDYQKWCFTRLYNDFFYHRHNEFWYKKAMSKLPPLLESTKMLVCGEDLGMIPDCVPSVMHNQHILSLEIQRMPKDPAQEFGNPYWYPYECVCTTSTHDMSGIRGWWEENREKTQHFYNEMLHGNGDAPYFAEPWICERILDMHLESPAMLTILPLQDWLSMDGQLRYDKPQDEQINIPAISRHYWRYRMHITMEDLIANTFFTEKVKHKIKSSGR